MKNPKNMTTDELIDLADEMKSGMTTSWIERRNTIKQEGTMPLADPECTPCFNTSMLSTPPITPRNDVVTHNCS